MKIERIGQRIYNDEVNDKQTVESAEYVVKDGDRELGRINATQWNVSLNISMPCQNADIDAGVTELATLIGAEIIEKGGAE